MTTSNSIADLNYAPRFKDRARWVARIARDYLSVDSLIPQNRDCLDFHEIGVGVLKEALEAAYEAGRMEGRAEVSRKLASITTFTK